MVDTAVQSGHCGYTQMVPAIAWGEAGYLVAWLDERNEVRSLRASRVNRAGMPLDSAPILVCDNVYGHRMPPPPLQSRGIAFASTCYLIAWLMDDKICAVRVDDQGAVLDAEPIAICRTAGNRFAPVVASDGVDFLVCWQDAHIDEQSHIRGSFVSEDGTVLNPEGFLISPDTGEQTAPSVCYGRGNYLVAWQGAGGIHGTRLGRTGAILDPNDIGFDAPGVEPVVGTNGTDYLVVWRTGDYGMALRATRVLQSGAVLDHDPIIVSSGNVQYDGRRHVVDCDSMNYRIAWAGGDQWSWVVRTARVNQSGEVLDPDGLTVVSGQRAPSYPALACHGGEVLLAWDCYDFGIDILGSPMKPDGELTDSSGIDVSLDINEQVAPAAAWNGSSFLAAWRNQEGGPASFERAAGLRGRRLDGRGSLLEPRSCGIFQPDSGFYYSGPLVAANNNGYLTLWPQQRRDDSLGHEIRGRRVDGAGRILDPDGITIARCGAITPAEVSAASDGTDFLVTWLARGQSVQALYAVAVRQDGTCLDAHCLYAASVDTGIAYPSIAPAGQGYCVFWVAGNGINGLRASRDGRPLDPQPFLVAVPKMPAICTQAAFDGDRLLVTWLETSLTDTLNEKIRGTFVTRDGASLDTVGFTVCEATGPMTWCTFDIVYDGYDYVVAWEDRLRGVLPYRDTDIFGLRMNRSGVAFDSFAVAARDGEQTSPALVSAGNGRVVVLYSSWTGVANGRRYDAKRVWGKFMQFTGIEEPRPRPVPPAMFLVCPTIGRRFTVQVAAVSSLLTPNSLLIYDATGRIVETLRLSLASRGLPSTVTWDASRVPAGVYFIRLTADASTPTRKVVVER